VQLPGGGGVRNAVVAHVRNAISLGVSWEMAGNAAREISKAAKRNCMSPSNSGGHYNIG
jgi:hypothetical protein